MKRSELVSRILTMLDKLSESYPVVIAIEGPEGYGKSELMEQIQEKYNYCFCVPVNLHHNYEPVFNLVELTWQQLLKHPRLQKKAMNFPTGLDPAGKILEHKERILKVMQEAADAQHPILMLWEDLHFADARSLELIALLMEKPPSLPFGIVFSYNNEKTTRSEGFLRLKTLLRKTNCFFEFTLKPFDEQETRQYLELQLGNKIHDELLAIVQEKTGGNPYFIKEVIGSLQASNLLAEHENGTGLQSNFEIPVPESIKEMFLLKLSNLSQEALYTLDVAAMIGYEFDFLMLSEVVKNDDYIDQLLTAGIILEEEPGKGRFRHRIMQEVVKKEIIWSRRKRISKDLAEIFENRDQNPDLIGQYWEFAGERQKARKAYVKAAKLYCNVHAHWDAVQVANKALEMWPDEEDEEERIDILHSLVKCTQVGGQLPESIRILSEILESPLIQADPVKLAETQRALAKAYALQGIWKKSNDFRTEAALNWEKAGNYQEAVQDWIEVSNRKMDMGDFSGAFQAAESAVDAARKLEYQGLLSKALSIKAYVLSIIGKEKEAAETSNEAVRLAESLNDKEVLAYAYRKLAGVLELSSNFVESIKIYDSALNFCQREDLNMQAVFCLSCMSWVLFRLGDWKRALEVSQEVINDPATNNASRSIAYAVLALIRGYRGEVKSAANNIRQSYEYSRQENYQLIIFIQIWAEAIVEEGNGNVRHTYFNYKKLLDEWYHKGDVHDVLGGLFAAGTFFFEQKQRPEINETLKVLDQIVSITGNSEAMGFLHYLQALVAMLENNYTVAKSHLEDSKSLIQPVNIPLQMIYLEFYEAQVLKALNLQNEALEVLQRVVLNARNMGMRRMVGQAETLIGQIQGLVNIDTGSTGSIILTRRQKEIMHELATGLSNKEIAARLHLSTRTVDMHVRNIFDQLNCRSRTEAVKIAVEKGVLD